MRCLLRAVSQLALVLAIALPALHASANPNLEAQLRTQLDRMFFPEQYVLDIRPTSNQDSSVSETSSRGPLPGLAISSDPGAIRTLDPLAEVQGNLAIELDTEILLVVDKSISQERMEIAEEVVKHILQSFKNAERLNLKMSQRDVLKTMPDALKQSMGSGNMPQYSQQNPPPYPPQYPSQSKAEDDEKESAKQIPEKNFMQTVMENRDFALRALFVLWAALGSLVGIFAVLRGISSRNSAPNVTVENRTSRESGASTVIAHHESISPLAAAAAGGPASGGAPRSMSGVALRRAATREELYSKDEAAAKLNAEIVSEASEFPIKTARILSRWVETGSENIRYANMFLKNCDVKTVESICSHMHPADIEAIMSKKIDGFDPFGDENARVMELMREEIALMAASQSVQEKTDPMEFARVMPEEDMMILLADEDPVAIAAVVAHLRPHRVARLFKEIGTERFAEIMEVFANGENLLSHEFTAIRDRLAQKAVGIQGNPMSGKNRIKTIAQMIEAISHPNRQREAMLRLLAFDSEMFDCVRKNILLPDDFDSFSIKAVRTITQNVEADVLGSAFCGLQVDLESFLQQMPEGYRIVFDEVRVRELPDSAVEDAWKKTTGQIRNLLENGILSNTEIALGKSATDTRIRSTAERAKHVA